MACPSYPIPAPSCGNEPCEGAMPYDAATGAAEQSFSFLETNYGSIDLSWFNLYESGGSATNPETGLGANWSLSILATSL